MSAARARGELRAASRRRSRRRVRSRPRGVVRARAPGSPSLRSAISVSSRSIGGRAATRSPRAGSARPRGRARCRARRRPAARGSPAGGATPPARGLVAQDRAAQRARPAARSRPPARPPSASAAAGRERRDVAAAGGRRSAPPARRPRAGARACGTARAGWPPCRARNCTSSITSRSQLLAVAPPEAPPCRAADRRGELGGEALGRGVDARTPPRRRASAHDRAREVRLADARSRRRGRAGTAPAAAPARRRATPRARARCAGPTTKVSKVYGSTSCASGRVRATRGAPARGATLAARSAEPGRRDADVDSRARARSGRLDRHRHAAADLARQAADARARSGCATRSRWNALGARSTRRSGSSRALSGRIQASRLTAGSLAPSRRRTPSQTLGGEVIQLLPLNRVISARNPGELSAFPQLGTPRSGRSRALSPRPRKPRSARTAPRSTPRRFTRSHSDSVGERRSRVGSRRRSEGFAATLETVSRGAAQVSAQHCTREPRSRFSSILDIFHATIDRSRDHEVEAAARLSGPFPGHRPVRARAARGGNRARRRALEPRRERRRPRAAPASRASAAPSDLAHAVGEGAVLERARAARRREPARRRLRARELAASARSRASRARERGVVGSARARLVERLDLRDRDRGGSAVARQLAQDAEALRAAQQEVEAAVGEALDAPR